MEAVQDYTLGYDGQTAGAVGGPKQTEIIQNNNNSPNCMESLPQVGGKGVKMITQDSDKTRILWNY